jgi:hypothetical protein
MSGALGADNVQPSVPTAPLGAPVPSPLAPTSAAAPQPSAGLLNPDVANAGVSSVPQFTAPVNPATAVHHSVIGGLLGKIGHVAHQAYDNFTTNVAGLSAADLATMDPHDIAVAKRQALSGFLSRASHPAYDAAGFRENGIQANSAGVGAGREQAQGFVGRAREAAQYASGLAQTGRIQEARGAVGRLFDHQNVDDWDKDALANRLESGVIQLTTAGDDKGAAVLSNTIKNIRDARARGQSINQFLQDASGIFLGNKETGDLKMIHKNTVTPVKLAQADARIAQSKENSDRGMTKHYDNYTQKVVGHFLADTADLRKENGAYNQFAAIAKESAGGNPEAYKSAIINFMGALDPKAQVRSKMLEFAQQVDPTIAGRWDTLMQKITDGTFPANQISGMIQVAQATHEATKRQYMAKRNDYISSNPDLDLETALPSEDAEFADATYGTTPAPRAAAPRGTPAPAAGSKTVAPSLKAIFDQ